MTQSHNRPEADYQQLLDGERNPVPAALREQAELAASGQVLSVDRYLSREFHQREKQQLWPRVWQAVCRETEVAGAGDYYVHEIADVSLFVQRDEQGQLRAFRNACRHRGRQLKNGSASGKGSSLDIRCPFHGFSWNLQGDFTGAPCQWDFPQIDQADFPLGQLRLETWGGWVFVNLDPNAESLLSQMGVMAQHFERWKPEECYKALHIRKVIRCNWKLAHEAFIESYHTVATHPQLLPYTGDTLSQYDCFNDHVSRTMTPMGVISSHLSDTTEQDAVHQWLRVYGVGEPGAMPEIPQGVSAREYLGEMNIRRFSDMYQQDLSAIATHAEVLDAILYSIFPNFAPWAGFRPNVTYRFLPYQDSHEMCTMDIMLLMRFPAGEARPDDAAIQFVGPDQSLADTPGIDAGLAKVFDQDFSNLPRVHRGLYALEPAHIQLAQYQESRIRHFHQTLDKYLQDNNG
jgi:phenylpropionate dioxygenase-like ring-hydroxylating dioxygenase large terminal subunit